MFAKERSARMKLQQELVTYKDQCSKLEQLNEDLQEECKSIPTHQETCEMLKNDLSKARKQFQGERKELVGKVRKLEKELSVRDMDGLKTDVRKLALRLLDMSTSNNNNSAGAAVYPHQSRQFTSSPKKKNDRAKKRFQGRGSVSSYHAPTASCSPSPYQSDYEFEEDEQSSRSDEERASSEDSYDSEDVDIEGNHEQPQDHSPMQSDEEVDVRLSSKDTEKDREKDRRDDPRARHQEHGRRSKSSTVVYEDTAMDQREDQILRSRQLQQSISSDRGQWEQQHSSVATLHSVGDIPVEPEEMHPPTRHPQKKRLKIVKQRSTGGEQGARRGDVSMTSEAGSTAGRSRGEHSAQKPHHKASKQRRNRSLSHASDATTLPRI